MKNLRGRLAVSPCSNPEWDLDSVLAAYAEIGFRKFEVFTSWCKSAFDVGRDPGFYLRMGRKHGMTFSSLHLPPVDGSAPEQFAPAVAAARFAAALGVKVVLFKAKSRPAYVQAARPFLDAIQGLPVTPVLQNHKGTPITTLEDFREVLAGIGDPRLKALLEVGHFHSVGVSWRAGWELLKDRLALVHIKDQVGAQSVPFGTGEVDLMGLLRHLDATGYAGDLVVEMETSDQENRVRYLREAFAYLLARGEEVTR
jgi:sugar phosphate isomerase/epimerase